MDNQLTILSESLDEKLQVLQMICEFNERQEQALKSEQVNLEEFDAAADEKGELIERLERLDDGFEALYQGIAAQLKDNKERYAAQIKVLQDKIAKVTELSVKIQAQEARNKQLVEEFFHKARTGLGNKRKSSRAAYGYYQNMRGAGVPNGSTFDGQK